MQVREKTFEELKAKLSEMKTDLNKIDYLESAMKGGFSLEINRFIWDSLSDLYEGMGMFEKAAKSMASRAGLDTSYRDKIETYLKAGEFYAKAGKIHEAENMFVRATRNATVEQKAQIALAMRNIFRVSAKALEDKGKKAHALKFYERLIKMKLEDIEKKEIKEKLVFTYKALGRFKDAELLEGI
jgi:tetratricopeptide (TPR) repeat protein